MGPAVTAGVEPRFGLPHWPVALPTRRPERPDDAGHAVEFLAVLIEERDHMAADLAVRRAATPDRWHLDVDELEAELRYLEGLVEELRRTLRERSDMYGTAMSSMSTEGSAE